MTWDNILEAIKRTATGNDGNALGMDKFFEQTGIRRTDREGKYWTKWSDTIIEARFKPNQFSLPAYELNWILEQFAGYTRPLGHYPTKSELKIKNYNDKSFSSSTTIRKRLRDKSAALLQIIEFCQLNDKYADVLKICKNEREHFSVNTAEANISDEKLGTVHLMKSGKHYKIG